MPSPLVAGDASIANRWLNGSAVVMWIGDSISAALEPFLLQTFRVTLVGRAFPGSAFGGLGSSAWATLATGGLGATGLLTERNYSPFATKESVFTGSAVPVTGDPVAINSRIMSDATEPLLLGTRTAQVFGGSDWLAGRSNPRLRVVMYRNAQSASGVARNDIHSVSTVFKGVGAFLNLASPAGPAYYADDIPFTAPALAEDLAIENQSFEGATPTAGTNFVVCCALVTNGDAGFTFVPASVGSWDVLHWTDTSVISDAALAGVLPLLGITDFVIALGQNNPTNQTASDFQTSLIQMTNRLRAAVPGASITFLPTYDTDSTGSGTTHLPGFVDAHCTAQRLVPNSCFLNLYAAAGPWSQLNAAGYLSGGGVNPSAAGAPYFLQTIQGLLEQLLAGPRGAPAAGRYAAQDDVEDVFGVVNVAHWSSQDSTATTADVPRVQRALDYADAAIDDFFRGGPYVVPLVPGTSATTVRRWAAILAGAWLSRAMSTTSGSSASASLSLPAGGAFSASVNSSADPYASLVTEAYGEMGACKAGVVALDCAPAATLATAPAVAY